MNKYKYSIKVTVLNSGEVECFYIQLPKGIDPWTARNQFDTIKSIFKSRSKDFNLTLIIGVGNAQD